MLLLSAAFAADPGFTVTPSGWVRPAFSWREDDDALPSTTDGFSLAARMGLEAAAEPYRLRARIEVELQPEPSLTDAFLNFSPAPFLSINAGQLKVPFSVQYLSADTRRQLPQNAPITDAASFGRDIGALAEVRLPIAKKVRATLSGGAFNGEGRNRLENVNEDFLYALRLNVTPMGTRERPFEGTGRDPYLGVGGGWVYNLTGEDSTATEINAFQAELQLALGVFSLQGEYLDKEIFHADESVPDYHVRGGYGQIGCFIPAPWAREHLELAARGGWMDPNTELASAPEELAIATIEGGINLYVPEAPRFMHDTKLQVAFRHVIELEGPVLDDDRLDVAVIARF